MSEAKSDSRPPRGALIVVAVGILACIAAALLTTEKGGSASEVPYVAELKLPESRSVTVPGGSQKMLLYNGQIHATEVNSAGYRLFRTAATLRIDAGAPVGSARVHCSVKAPPRTVAAQSYRYRASYPRSSEELQEQPVPENVVITSNTSGGELALLRLNDAFKEYASEPGIKVEWPAPYREGEERWTWFLPPGAPKQTLKLGFATIWRTAAKPGTEIACTVTTNSGSATVRTAGKL